MQMEVKKGGKTRYEKGHPSMYLAVNLMKDFKENMKSIEQYQEERHQILRRVTQVTILCFLIMLAIAYVICHAHLRYNDFIVYNGIPISRIITGTAFCIYMVNSAILLMPYVVNKDQRQSQSARYCVTAINLIAGITNLIMTVFPIPLVYNPHTRCLVNLLRWSEWCTLSFLMTFLVEIVDSELEEAFFTAILQFLSTSCGLLFPFAPSFSSFIGLLCIASLLFVYLFRRFYCIYMHNCELRASSESWYNLACERSNCACHLMKICCIFWTIFVATYFGEWALRSTFELHEHYRYIFVIDTIVELVNKFFYGIYIMTVQERLLDPAAARKKKVEIIRHTMHIIWQSSHDIIVLSFPEQTHVSPGFHSLIGINPEVDFEIERDSSGLHRLIDMGWKEKSPERTLEFNLIRQDKNTVHCEVVMRKLDSPRVLVIIIRDISERVRLHNIEKQIMVQEVERRKDLEATRFTQHEVKNGILDAQAQLTSLRENFDRFWEQGLISPSVRTDLCLQCTQISERLERTLSTVAGNAIAKDIINDLYEPRPQPVEVVSFIQEICSFSHLQSNPCPFPRILIDPQILGFICKNAVSNAHKYGKVNGDVNISIQYLNGRFKLIIENQAGPNHRFLLQLEDPNVIFSRGWRLPQNKELNLEISSGDGAWIMRKCVEVIGGYCSYEITKSTTSFVMECNTERFVSTEEEDLPNFIKVLAIDDSLIQIKLMQNLFMRIGIKEENIMVFGKTFAEIENFPQKTIETILHDQSSLYLVIIDENLDYFCAKKKMVLSRKGTDMVRPILHGIQSSDATTIIVIRSANNSAEDQQKYLATGAHATLDKQLRLQKDVTAAIHKIILENVPQERLQALHKMNQRSTNMKGVKRKLNETAPKPADRQMKRSSQSSSRATPLPQLRKRKRKTTNDVSLAE